MDKGKDKGSKTSTEIVDTTTLTGTSLVAKLDKYRSGVTGQIINLQAPGAIKKIDELYKLDKYSAEELDREIKAKIGSLETIKMNDLDNLAHLDPIGYHRYFIEKEEEIISVTKEIVKRTTILLSSVGFDEKLSLKIAVELTKPMLDRYMLVMNEFLRSKNILLKNKADSYINRTGARPLESSITTSKKPTIKYDKISASSAGLSEGFEHETLPGDEDDGGSSGGESEFVSTGYKPDEAKPAIVVLNV